MFNKDQIILHDCDNVKSNVTKLDDHSTVEELVDILIKERDLYNQVVYESNDYSNINIIKPINEIGKTLHSRLISNSAFSVFPKKVLVLANNKIAKAFKQLNANVTFIDISLSQNIDMVTLLKNNNLILSILQLFITK